MAATGTAHVIIIYILYIIITPVDRGRFCRDWTYMQHDKAYICLVKTGIVLKSTWVRNVLVLKQKLKLELIILENFLSC